MLSVTIVNDLLSNQYDCVVVVNDSLNNFNSDLKVIESSLAKFKEYHPRLESILSLVPFDEHPSKRLIFSPIKSLNDDFDDSRRIYEASNAGIKMAIDLGLKSPLLVFGNFKTLPNKKPQWAYPEFIEINILLGALFAAYVPLEIREDVPSRAEKLKQLGVYRMNKNSLEISVGLEEGRRVARDIGGSDPERMAAPRIAEFIEKEFKNSVVKVEIEKVDKTKYPLMAAVNRAAASVPRHEGRVVKFEYVGADPIEETVFLVGKGITYDTGGADVKAGGIMAGMHRDKCGAAAVTGFFKSLSILKPKNIKVFGFCAYVRNSIGEECYVADEIITSRAKKRVRVGNTDAEGRMVMADLLCEAKEMALNAINPSLFTVATLTGHVIRAYGDKYTGVMGNGLSREKNIPKMLQDAGDLLAEPVEISTIRREDILFHKGFHEYEDILQCNNSPSSATARGHQSPAAFLILASGLDNHNLLSPKPLPFTHVDCAGSAGFIGSLPTAAPLLMFAAKYIIPRLK